MIKITNLKKAFGEHTAVDIDSFTINEATFSDL